MHNTSARVVLVQERVRQLRRRREKRAIGTLTTAGAAVAAAVICTLGAVMSGAPAAETGLYGSMLLYGDAGGYVLVGVVSFTVAVVITALCMKYRYKREKQGQEEEKK